VYKRWAAVAAASVTVLSAAAAAPAAAAPSDAVSVTIDAAHPAGRLAGDAVGLSFEMRELGIGNLDSSKGNVTQLFKTLGTSNLRIAGNTLDRDTLWVGAGQLPPDPKPDWVQDIVTPNDIQRLGRLLDKTGWKAEVGINMGQWDVARGADQAKTMSKVLGKKLTAVECGNEPDQWVGKAWRPAGYNYENGYHSDWLACAAVVPDRTKIAGPDTAGSSSTWAASLAADEHTGKLGMVTVHQYGGGAAPTIDSLLAPAQIPAQLDGVKANLAAATAAGLPMRVDEANSSYNGGIDGVSNKYASALWAIDYSLSMAQAGLAGVNIHGGLGVCNDPIWNGKFQRYTPFCAANKAYELAQVYKAMPIYYGLWMARQMGPGRFLPVQLTSERNTTAYAVRGDDGHTRIALVQKDETSTAPVTVTLNVGGGSRTAKVLHMTGTALADEPTAVQGATVDIAGKLKPGKPDAAQVRGGVLTLTIPAGSAAIITL
jgi:hypothetical protein